MNVLVYSGPEVLQSSLTHSLSTLRSLLVPNYTVQTISAQALASQPWTTACALVVLPACRHAPGPATHLSLSSYVNNGGSLLVLGADSRHPTSSASQFAQPDPSSLEFLDESGKALDIHFHARDDGIMAGLIQNESQKPAPILLQTKNATVNAAQPITIDVLTRNADNAIITDLTKIRDGTVAVSELHLDYPLTSDIATTILARISPPLSPEAIQVADFERTKLLKDVLRSLGLRLPEKTFTTGAHPLPQFLIGSPFKPHIVNSIIAPLSIASLSSAPSVLEDGNDTFHFHLYPEGIDVLNEARLASSSGSSATSWQPKHIIVCADELPSPEDTPLFSLKKYFSELALARERSGCSQSTQPWGMGEALIYGEVVTSTQTLLDKNPRLLSSLHTPIVSLATQQLSGRGRGANVWLSPAGCLQFSVLLRVPLSIVPAARLVFVQYLFGLAVVEACRTPEVLAEWGDNVRLKWPNDIYALVGAGNYPKKIGGILVNTSFSGGKVEIVIGCGVNVLNPPPITSLSQLVPLGAVCDLSMERTAASILATFERMWDTFLAEQGSFEPFMDLYLERWLHSDQLITLATTTPAQMVRIAGITSDHGLLRTVPQRDGWSGDGAEFIDLQPDGNSFDLMAGLIKTKT